MKQDSFMGTGVAVITPFREDRTVDFKSLGKLLQHLLTNHVDYLLILGTTGEPATLSKDEKRAVIDYASEVVNHKVPIMVGFGGNNTSEVIKSIHEHGTEGIDGVLSICQ
ncbi:MAG: 4-hydroxy-tetrahydrodipicolinate synthase, partial [Bacteroidales bacterium]|nr:4-hydroxy-tetrahydrodipicolinate synthase [Bacteroidales bacterium]